jgi:hypothetical protein
MRFFWVLPAAALLTSVVSFPRCAQAQSNEVSPKGKGITGGALLGGEVVMLTEAALGARPAWAYIAGGLAGAIGGGVGGYFAEKDGSAKLSLYLLAGGMALAIPTTVAVLSATAYQVPADYTQDRAPTEEPVAEPPQPAATEPAQTPATTAPPATTTPPAEAAPPAEATPPAAAPQSRRPGRRGAAHATLLRPDLPPALVGWGRGYLTLSVPAIEVRDAYTAKERAELGVRQATEVRVPVFSARF